MSKNNKEALLYLLPAAVLFLVFYYWPLLQNIYLSVFSWNMISLIKNLWAWKTLSLSSALPS